MDTTSIIAGLAAIFSVAGFLGVLSTLTSRPVEAERVERYLAERQGLLEKRTGLRRSRRERLRGLREEASRRIAEARAKAPPEKATAEAAADPPAGPSAAAGPDLAAIAKDVKARPEEAAAVLRAFIRGATK